MENPLDLAVTIKGKAQITNLEQQVQEHFYSSLLSSILKLKQEASETTKPSLVSNRLEMR